MEIFSYVFFRNAIIIGMFASVACGIIGSFVVVKRISFISGSIAHSSFGGIGLAYFLGFNPIIGAIVFSILSALGIGVISEKFKAREDSMIGAMWSLGMAIGLAFIYLTPGYSADLFSYLFGNILMATNIDLILAIILDLFIIISVIAFYRWFVAIIFDKEFATVTNIAVFPIYLFLLCLIALTVVVLIRIVGVILVIALLVLPSATAQIFNKNFKKIILWSILFGNLFTISGIFLSYFFNMPSGPAIVFVSSFVYIMFLLLDKFFKTTYNFNLK
ncbi:MAG: metal ABC transporter permease [Patescibacteria group bacterium]|nr:metal ABC transporter permease [Patescibacteria group bacterium]